MPKYLYSLQGKRVWVAGHLGMVGSAIVRRLATEDCHLLAASRDSLDLRRQDQLEAWMAEARPQAIFLAAARVGGIHANDTRPAEFIHDNLAIATNVIEAAHKMKVEKLLFLGSSCIYPRLAPQPIPEEALLAGPLEPTNQWYAIAKIAGIKLCQAYRRQYGCDFVSAMPCNLYGIGDNFDLQSSHVIPALIAKAHRAKMARSRFMDVWGTGQPRREFLYADDLADAAVYLMRHYSGTTPINVGSGRDVSIAELAELVCGIVGFKGRLRFDARKPDGTPRKLLDVRRLASLGWRPRTELRNGLEQAYQWFVDNEAYWLAREAARA
jgi:GDP-L-fucose synthase